MEDHAFETAVPGGTSVGTRFKGGQRLGLGRTMSCRQRTQSSPGLLRFTPNLFTAFLISATHERGGPAPEATGVRTSPGLEGELLRTLPSLFWGLKFAQSVPMDASLTFLLGPGQSQTG